MLDQEALNYGEALRRKVEGMALAADRRKELLRIARGVARRICRGRGYVTTDDVRVAFDEFGLEYSDLGNAAGSIFLGKEFEWTGDRIKSAAPARHGNEIKVWRRR